MCSKHTVALTSPPVPPLPAAPFYTHTLTPGGCYLYGRSYSPTVQQLSRQLAAMENTEAAYAVASGTFVCLVYVCWWWWWWCGCLEALHLCLHHKQKHIYWCCRLPLIAPCICFPNTHTQHLASSPQPYTIVCHHVTPGRHGSHLLRRAGPVQQRRPHRVQQLRVWRHICLYEDLPASKVWHSRDLCRHHRHGSSGGSDHASDQGVCCVR